MNTRSSPSEAAKRAGSKPTTMRGSRCTTSDAWPWKVTVGNTPRIGATAPSVSHRNETPSTPTPPVTRPGSNSSHRSCTNSSGPIPSSAGTSGRNPPMQRNSSPGRVSSTSSTSASRAASPSASSSQHNAAAVTASSAARSAVRAARPPLPAHSTNTVNNTSTGTTSTSSNDIVPDSSPVPAAGPGPGLHRPQEPQRLPQPSTPS